MMKGAIFYSTKYGSTAQYAKWIGDASELPVYNVDDSEANPANYDFLVLGCPIIYYKPIIHNWVKRNLAILEKRPVILFTVSGASAGPKLDGWINACLPKTFVAHMKHVALRGRQNPKDLTWWDWLMLKIGGLKNPDPVARKEEMKGFDYMDQNSIKPILDMVERMRGVVAH